MSLIKFVIYLRISIYNYCIFCISLWSGMGKDSARELEIGIWWDWEWCETKLGMGVGIPYGNGREWELKNHSRSYSIQYTTLFIVDVEQCRRNEGEIRDDYLQWRYNALLSVTRGNFPQRSFSRRNSRIRLGYVMGRRKWMHLSIHRCRHSPLFAVLLIVVDLRDSAHSYSKCLYLAGV